MTSFPFRALSLVVPALLLAWGCKSSVDAFDGGEQGECEDPPPPSAGFCPASWVCIDGEWVDTGGDCPDPCPIDRPAEGSACTEEGLECGYFVDEEPCGQPAHDETVKCLGGAWTTLGPRCEPPPECPEALPTAGGDCTGWADAFGCNYTVESSCGDLPAFAYCDTGTWTWSVELSETCGACDALSDAASCSAAPGCRWLVPGCGEPPLPSEGCFAAEDCVAGGCDEGETCTLVVINPCWNSPCDACGADANVCLGDGG